MISLPAQIQAVLDSLGIHLDSDSFSNLLVHLRVGKLSWAQKTALAVALGVLVQYLRKEAEERAKAAQAALESAGV